MRVPKKRILITGAQGTGKTTLLNAWVKRNPKWRGLPEVARLAKEAGLPLDQGASMATQLWILNQQLCFERHIPAPWVADRGLVDVWVYAKVLKLQQKDIDHLERQIRQYWKYSFTVLLPPEFAIIPDGVRSTDIDFQNQLHNTYLEFFDTHDVLVYELTGSVEDRLTGLQEKLKLYDIFSNIRSGH